MAEAVPITRKEKDAYTQTIRMKYALIHSHGKNGIIFGTCEGIATRNLTVCRRKFQWAEPWDKVHISIHPK